MRFTIGRKLFSMVGALLALAVVIWALSTINLKKVGGSYEEALKENDDATFLVEKEVDHLNWVNSLSEVFTLNQAFDKQLDHHKCGFGQWYYELVGSDEFSKLDPETQTLLKEIEEPHRNLHQSAVGIKEHYHGNWSDEERNAALEIFKTDTKESLAHVQSLLESLKERRYASSKQSLLTAENQASSSITMNLVITIVSIILGLILAVFITRSITHPTNNVVEMLKDIAQGEGDLTKRLNIKSKDEIGDLAGWFNTFMDKLHDIIYRVTQNTEQLASAATEVSSAAEQLSAGSKEQTGQTAQVSAAIEQMTATIMESSKNTQDASDRAREAAESSKAGSRLAEDTSQGMEEIVQSASVTAGNIQGLAEKATAIGEIIKVIDDIADQTNLLALNAAIEAARAGEQGRGFAVVADEVRKLAERTTKATKEVAETIKGIQTDVTKANSQMEESSGIVNKGKDLVVQTNSSLNEIFNAIEGVQEMMRQIAAAAEEQSAAAEEISKSVENVDRISREAANGAEQAATAAEQLSRQSEDLRGLVSGFKLRSNVGEAL